MMRQIAIHSIVTALAVGLAFALPEAARYILFQWWPRAEVDGQLLLFSELILAAVVVLLFHAARIAWEARSLRRISQVAALIEVRDSGKRFALRDAHRRSGSRLPVTRDALVLAMTGYDTFVAADSELGRIIGSCYEIRVLLLSPHSVGAAQRARSFADARAALHGHRRELRASIRYLKQLNCAGKKVRLRLYESAPFWKVVIVGEHAWIQYCHDGYEVKSQPEYVFALRHDRPEQGLFPPFYMHVLNLWNDPGNAEYDLASDELVFRDTAGSEVRRIAYPLTDACTASTVPSARAHAVPPPNDYLLGVGEEPFASAAMRTNGTAR
jgi:hypothetical protein